MAGSAGAARLSGRDRGDAQPLVDAEPGAPAAVDGDAAVCVLEPADAVLAVCVVWVDGGAVCVAAAVLSLDAGLAVAEVVLVGVVVGGAAVLVGGWVTVGVVAAPLVAVDVPAATDALVAVASLVAGAAEVAVAGLAGAGAGAGALFAACEVVTADSDVPAVEPLAADAVDPLCALATGEGAAVCVLDDESPPALVPVAGPLAAWLRAAVVSLWPLPTAAVGVAWIDDAAVDALSAGDPADADDAG